MLEPIPTSRPDNGEAVDGSNGLTAAPLLPALTNDGTAAPIGSLYLMSLGFLLPNRSSAVVWRGPKKTAMVRQFLTDVLWPPIDYLLVDTPPGTSDEHISLAEQLLKLASPDAIPIPHNTSETAQQQPQLAGAVIVTTPQAVAISDVRKELNFCTKVGIKILGVVENMSGYICECCGLSTNLFGKGGGEAMSVDFGATFLGGVPIDGQWGVLVEEGKRPRYGNIQQNANDGDGSEHCEKADLAADGQEEPTLLVDRYRSCTLSGVFERIAKDVVHTIEDGS